MMFLIIFLAIFTSPAVHAEEINPLYSAGLKSYQESNFEQAKQNFLAILNEDPRNPLVNYNLGLTEWKLGRAGMALALLRRAQYGDPSFGEAVRLENAIKDSLKVKDLPHQISMWEALRQQILKPLSLDTILVVLALLILVTGYNIPRYLGARRRISSGKDNPVAPAGPLSSLISGTLLAAVIAVTVMKFFDLNIQRGTIVVEKVDALSGPEVQSSSLFELFEGLEVIVRRSFLDSNQKEWVQVTYPGGMTGWIPAESLVSHSEWKLGIL